MIIYILTLNSPPYEYYCSMLHNLLDTNTYEYVFMKDELEYRIVALLSQHKGKINTNWILLDSQSTIDIFCNPKLMKNIKRVEKSTDIHCNTAVTTKHMVGDLDGYDTVWYDPNGMDNILSLHRVIENYHVKFDSRSGDKFIV